MGFEPLRKTSPKKRGVTNPLQYEELYLPKNEEPLYPLGIFHAPVDFPHGRLVEDLPLSKFDKWSRLDVDPESNNIPDSYTSRLYENQYGSYRPSYLEYPSPYKYYGDRKKRSNKLNIP